MKTLFLRVERDTVCCTPLMQTKLAPTQLRNNKIIRDTIGERTKSVEVISVDDLLKTEFADSYRSITKEKIP